jgi:hypothetical protein
VPAAMNTRDLTICPTSQPTARAASTAVRVPAGNSFTARSVCDVASHDSNRLTVYRIGGATETSARDSVTGGPSHDFVTGTPVDAAEHWSERIP